jgi:hypothetical protein
MFITIKRAKDTPMTYESVPTEDILTQQAEYEKMGPYGPQIAYAVALGIAGVIGVLVVMCLLHSCFRRRRARSTTTKNLQPLKLSSTDTSTTSDTSSTSTAEQELKKQKASEPERAESQVRVFGVQLSFRPRVDFPSRFEGSDDIPDSSRRGFVCDEDVERADWLAGSSGFVYDTA